MQWRPDTSRRGIEKVPLVNLYCLVSRWVHLVFCIRHDFIAHCVEIARGASILTQVSPTPSCKYLLQVSIHKYLTQVSYTSILHEYLLHPLRETLSPSQKSKYKHKYLLHPLTSILHTYLTSASYTRSQVSIHKYFTQVSYTSISNTLSGRPSHPLTSTSTNTSIYYTLSQVFYTSISHKYLTSVYYTLSRRPSLTQVQVQTQYLLHPLTLSTGETTSQQAGLVLESPFAIRCRPCRSVSFHRLIIVPLLICCLCARHDS